MVPFVLSVLLLRDDYLAAIEKFARSNILHQASIIIRDAQIDEPQAADILISVSLLIDQIYVYVMYENYLTKTIWTTVETHYRGYHLFSGKGVCYREVSAIKR